MKSARTCYPKICLFDIKKYFELNAIKKQQIQEKLFLPSPFLPKAGYKFTFYWRQSPISPRDGTKESANKPYPLVSSHICTFSEIATLGSLLSLVLLFLYKFVVLCWRCYIKRTYESTFHLPFCLCFFCMMCTAHVNKLFFSLILLLEYQLKT